MKQQNLLFRRPVALLSALLILVLASGCGVVTFDATPANNVFPTAQAPGTVLPTFDPGGFPNPFSTATPFNNNPGGLFPTLMPTATRPPVSLDGWIVVSTAMQYRTIQFRNTQSQTVDVLAVRFDPSQVAYRVYYTPGQPRTIQQWQQVLPGALAIVNGNYFNANYQALGIVASQGQISGFAALRTQKDDGMFQVKGGVASVRSMFLQPYQQGEAFERAAHSFPMLMTLGQVAPIMPDLASVSDRRTVIAQDSTGRIMFLTTSATLLKDMGLFLSLSGFNISSAVNMDGGNSTNMYINSGGSGTYSVGLRPVPLVIAVFPKK